MSSTPAPSNTPVSPARLDRAALDAALAECAASIAPVPDLLAAAAELLAPLMSATGARRASLITLNPTSGRLMIAAAVGLPADLIGRDLTPKPRSIASWVFRNRRALVLNGEVRDERFEAAEGARVIESAMCLPLLFGGEAIGVLNLARTAPAPAFGEDEMALLASLLTPVGVALERASGAIRAARTFEQLHAEIAKGMHSLLAIGISAAGPFEVGLARSRSALAGLDFCDRVPHANGGQTLMCAEVAGEGAQAAIAAALVQGVFLASAAPERSAAGLVARLDAQVTSRLGAGRSTALWIAQLTRGGEMSYCNAGMPAALWVPSDGSGPHRLDRGGPIAATTSAARYEEERVQLLPGDTVVVVSNGLCEARDESGQSFGFDRIAERVAECRRMPLDALTRALVEAAAEFAGSTRPLDDVSALAFRFTPGG